MGKKGLLRYRRAFKLADNKGRKSQIWQVGIIAGIRQYQEKGQSLMKILHSA